MNDFRRTTFMSRLTNAIMAFRGKPIQSLSLGLDIKRCDQCEYRGDANIREHLMVIMGARAAYMDAMATIDIPEGLEAEGKLVSFIKKTVERYLMDDTRPNFDEHIETALINEYANLKGENNNENLG